MDDAAPVLAADRHGPVAFGHGRDIGDGDKALGPLHENLLQVGHGLNVLVAEHDLDGVVVPALGICRDGLSLYAGLYLARDRADADAEVVCPGTVYDYLHLRETVIRVYGRLADIIDGIHHVGNLLGDRHGIAQAGGAQDDVQVVARHLLPHAAAEAERDGGEVREMRAELALYGLGVVYLLGALRQDDLYGA